jgi:membrane protease subunit HflC
VVIAREDQFKIILFFGDPVATLNVRSGEEWPVGWRIPFLTNVREFDRRLQYLNAEPADILIAGNVNLIVDYFVVWRITDPEQFMRNYPRGMAKAEQRIRDSAAAHVGVRIAGLELKQLLERAEILDRLGEEVSEEFSGEGLEVVDVRLSRTEIPRRAEPAAYAQMREQRRAISREYRAAGEREARTIRAKAESEARRVRAAAQAQSDILRGQGDAEAARIYADAYGKDAEFYAFWRSLEAYRNTIGERTTMVMSPDHEFFRFLEPEANWERPEPAGEIELEPTGNVPVTPEAGGSATPRTH